MDPREFVDDAEELMRVAFAAQRRYVWSTIPVVVGSSSTDGHTTTLQPTIKMDVTDPSGNVTQMPLPLLGSAPIHFAGGGGVTSTHPVSQGDEGLAIIASRSIDVWHQQGGVQQQIDGRMHSLSDAHYLPGIRSDPRKLQQVSTTSHQTRSDDKKMVIDHHPQNGTRIVATDPSTAAASATFDPFAQATKFFESLTHPSNGIAHNATDGGTTHSVTNDHTNGPKMAAVNGAHTVNAHPTNGVGIASTIAHTIAAPNASLSKDGIFNALKNVIAGQNVMAGQSVSAPSGSFGSMSFGSGGSSSSSGAIAVPSVQTNQAYTVAQLNSELPPTMGLQGMRVFVTDALSPVFLATLMGGGAAFSPAVCSGTTWVAG